MGYIPTMPYSRLIPTLVVGLLVPLVAWAQAPAPVPATEPPNFAEPALANAILQLRVREKIAAEIVQDVDMLNQKFSLEGTYYKDSDHRVRLQLKLKGLGDSGSTMLQVCDGKVLWDYQSVLGMQPNYRRRDIGQILKRLQDPALDDFFRSQVITQLGFGGPEAMLTGLQKAIKFDQFSDEKFEGVDSFIIGGTWRDRTGLLGPNDRPLGPMDRLPPYIPSNVRVFIDKANSWPYRIEMIGNAPLMLAEDNRQLGPDGRPIGVRKAPPKVDPSRITLKYKLLPVTEVKPELFAFSAPADASSANLVDETETFLGYLDNYIQNVLAQKKAEAAKAEGGPLLKAPPIEVPSPAPSTDLPVPR
jgi:hypothetical protein